MLNNRINWFLIIFSIAEEPYKLVFNNISYKHGPIYFLFHGLCIYRLMPLFLKKIYKFIGKSFEKKTLNIVVFATCAYDIDQAFNFLANF